MTLCLGILIDLIDHGGHDASNASMLRGDLGQYVVKVLEVPFFLFLVLARRALIGVLLLGLFCGASFRFSYQLRLALCGGSTWRWFSWGSLFGAFPSDCGLSLLSSQGFSGFALLFLFTQKFFFLLTSLSLLTLLNDLRIIV
jgi:hypothetical protein